MFDRASKGIREAPSKALIGDMAAQSGDSAAAAFSLRQVCIAASTVHAYFLGKIIGQAIPSWILCLPVIRVALLKAGIVPRPQSSQSCQRWSGAERAHFGREKAGLIQIQSFFSANGHAVQFYAPT